MCDELEERKQAMLMYHVQGYSKAVISRQLKRSRPWLDRWLARYDPGAGVRSLHAQKAGPKQGQSPWSAAIRQQVLTLRRVRSQDPQWRYAYRGAEALHFELKALGSAEVPPIRTLHTWFVAEGLVPAKEKEKAARPSKPIPIPAPERVNHMQQLDLKGPVYLTGARTKYYLVVLRDRYSQRCAIAVLENREAPGIVDFLLRSWQWLGLPDYLQMDNALEFRGSNRYPRAFGRLVRVAVALGLEPLFNPPGEPWRNGGVEWFNSFLGDRLLKIRFEDVQALRTEAQVCQEACNQSHYLPQFEGLTPHQLAASVTLRFPPQDEPQPQTHPLPPAQGFVSFGRLVRKSGRITLGAGDRFMVEPNLAYQYVLARVDLAKQCVHISYEACLLKTYDFSSETVGAWADEAQPVPDPLDEQVVKEQVIV